MSIKEVDDAIRGLLERDSRIFVPGNCRYAVKAMVIVAEKADNTPPFTEKQILVWPRAFPQAIHIHYAYKIADSEKNIVFNPNSTGMFPRYIGPSEKAPGYISQMKITKRVL
jgi:hypothetical protein